MAGGEAPSLTREAALPAWTPAYDHRFPIRQRAAGALGPPIVEAKRTKEDGNGAHRRVNRLIRLHFESDECGGMDRFLEQAPGTVRTPNDHDEARN
jgi:hypothetical protein